MDSEAARPPSSSPGYGSLHGPTDTRTRSRRRRLYRILRARLTTPILTSLLLLPVLPSSQLNLIFQLVPFARSARALLFPVIKADATEQSQWLAYWLLYAGVRLLESTRFRLDSLKEVQHLVRSVPRFLFSSAVARLSARSTPPLSSAASASTSMSAMTPAQRRRQRTQTLAAQLAGTPLRWTLFKSVLLFYAMDEELQGARWILEKLAKPCAAFFTGLEGAGKAAGSRRASRRAKIGEGDSDSEGQDMARLGERQCERQCGASTRGRTSGKRNVVLGSSTGTGTDTGTGTADPEDAAHAATNGALGEDETSGAATSGAALSGALVPEHAHEHGHGHGHEHWWEHGR